MKGEGLLLTGVWIGIWEWHKGKRNYSTTYTAANYDWALQKRVTQN